MLMTTITASKLRQNIYQLLDQVAEKGLVLEVVRKGKRIRIISQDLPDKLANIKRRDSIVGDPEDLVHVDWSSEWSEIK